MTGTTDDRAGPAAEAIGDDGTAAAHARAVGRALAALRAEEDERLSLAALAEIAGFSPFHFARVFR